MPAPSRLKPCAQLLAAAFIAFLGLAIGATAMGHAFDPEHIGLWSGPRAFFFGSLDTAMHVHQLPASTLYVVALMAVLLAFFVARELEGFARVGLTRRRT